MYQPRTPDQEYFSQFDLTSLAFADLILGEIMPEYATEEKAAPKTQLGPFETIRCICGKNDCTGDLIQCSECHCYLHRDCVELPNRRNSTFKCPFCHLQLDGIDPFRELRTWIEEKDNDIKVIHRILTEASQLDAKIQTSGFESQYGGNMRSSSNNVMRQNLQRTIQDVIERIRNLSVS